HSLESFRRENTQPILVKTHGFAKVTESFDYPTVAGIATLVARIRRMFSGRGVASGGCASRLVRGGRVLVLDGGRVGVRSICRGVVARSAADRGRGADPGARRLYGGGDDSASRGTG